VHWLTLDNRRMAMVEDTSVRNHRPLFVIGQSGILKYDDASSLGNGELADERPSRPGADPLARCPIQKATFAPALFPLPALAKRGTADHPILGTLCAIARMVSGGPIKLPVASGKVRVVIVGGGFAGIAAAWVLRRADAEIILIDRRNHRIFQPLLYKVAIGVLAPAEAVRQILLADNALRTSLSAYRRTIDET
jgi:hypothetical protein